MREYNNESQNRNDNERFKCSSSEGLMLKSLRRLKAELSLGCCLLALKQNTKSLQLTGP